MKISKPFMLVTMSLSFISFSCTREDLGSDPALASSESEIASTWNYGSTTPAVSFTGIAGDIAEIPNTGLSFCSIKTIQLCPERGSSVGSLIIRTGSDQKVYVTYVMNTTAWFLKKLDLYVGTNTNIPLYNSGRVNVSKFPVKKSMGAPYTVRKFTFVLNNITGVPTISAHADVVKVVNNRVKEQKSLWADGCNGTLIYHESNHGCGGGHNDDNNDEDEWATKFTYTVGQCTASPTPPPPPPGSSSEIIGEEPDICSNEPSVYFALDYSKKWPDVNGGDTSLNGHITLGGKDYSEGTGKGIYHSNAPNASPDARKAFGTVTALKLSFTDYALWPPLNNATITIENWLSTIPKLTPAHLPTPPQSVITAANTIEVWIANHPCPDRR
jgi:hypothetical protein